MLGCFPRVTTLELLTAIFFRPFPSFPDIKLIITTLLVISTYSAVLFYSFAIRFVPTKL